MAYVPPHTRASAGRVRRALLTTGEVEPSARVVLGLPVPSMLAGRDELRVMNAARHVTNESQPYGWWHR